MSHLVLSRKYRPQGFDELVGQEHVARTLSNAITSDRVGHAYLFIGPRGTGKTTTARIFAKALNCEKGPTPAPCGTCDSCVAVTGGSDLDVVEMDAASNNGVDDVRALRDSVGYRPARSRFRVWIVDEVHMLSLPAFNAFLKTLEEPPPQAKFLFCTTEAHKLPETFLSRVQRLEFRRIDEGKMSERLRALVEREGAAVEEGVLERIASGALGGLRDAESLLEQLLSSAVDRRVLAKDLDAVIGRAPAERVRAVLDAVLEGDAAAALDAADACLDLGGKPEVVLDQWVEELRALLGAAVRTKGPPAGAGAARASAADAPAPERASRFGVPRLARSIDLLLEKRRHLRDGADGRLVVEVAAVELARLPSARDLDALIDALKAGGVSAGSGDAGAAARVSPFAAQRPSSPSGGVPAARPPGNIAAPIVPRPLAPTVPTAPTAGDAGAPPPTSFDSTASSASPAAALTVESVLARWPDVLREAARDRRLASALARARPVGVDADAIVLALSQAETYARGVLRDRTGIEAFRTACRAALGAALRPAIVDEGSAPSSDGPPRPATARSPSASSAALPSSALSASPSAPATASGGPRADAAEDVRRHPDVKAVLDAFGARLLAVQRVGGGDVAAAAGTAQPATGAASVAADASALEPGA